MYGNVLLRLGFLTEFITVNVRLFCLGWLHTCNVTAYRNTVSWQCGRDSWPRNVSKVGYAVRLRAYLLCYRYLAVVSNGWYGYGRSRCGRATSLCTSTPAQALWCDGQIPTAHRTSPLTLQRNQLLIRYADTSPVHTVKIRCYDTR